MKQATPIDETVEALAQVHADRLSSLSVHQVGIEQVIDRIGRPWFAYAIVAFVALWIGGSAVLSARGLAPYDRPEYPWLTLALAIASLLMTALILISSNRQGDMDQRRAQVTLQFALVIEQKVSKLIEMIDAQNPATEAQESDVAHVKEMAKPIDVRDAVEHLETAQADALKERGLPPI
jgi:uncharacterized membrane protein